jgi:DNA-binding ferritin-like protein
MLLKYLIELQNAVRISHWRAKSYCLHETTDELYETLDGLVDRYAEVFIGKYGRDHLPTTIKLRHVDDVLFVDYMNFSYNKILKFDHATQDADLLHIRDEILEAISKAIYIAKIGV